MPLDHEVAEGLRFDQFADDYDASAQVHPVRTAVRRRVVERVRQLGGRIVLDVGCGTGQALIELSPDIELGIGVDVSRRMLSRAEQNARQAGCKNLRFRFGSFHDLRDAASLCGEALVPDAIIQNYALHHLSREEKQFVLAAMANVVNREQRGLIVLGDLMFFETPQGLEAEFAAAGYDPANDHPEPAADLAAMLEQLGFTTTLDRLHPLAGVITATRLTRPAAP